MQHETSLVSVIIPNYNHSRYLPLRIESVLNQTYRNIEVLLLDDCSPDNSLEVIRHYASQDSRITIVANQQNSGSTFKQWNKGIALAKGRYIWLAESDDYADKRLLEVLVAQLETDEKIGLAYCDSWSTDAENNVIGDWSAFYAELDPELWTRSFVREGRQMLNTFMSFRNIIPNASAVVLRKKVLEQVGPADETFRLNGDWVFWAKILAVSKVAFVAERLNYFRQHTNNVRSKTITDGTALFELTRMLYLLHNFTSLEPYFFDKMLNRLIDTWFTGMIEYDIALARHRQIYTNFKLLDKNFHQRFRREFAKRMFPNRMSGLRQLVGDGVLYRLTKRRHA